MHRHARDANLLRMLGEVRGYLALGEESYRDGYRSANEAFLSDMHDLEVLLRAKGEPMVTTPGSSAELGMRKIGEQFSAWQPLPEQLFELRNDQLRREPALKILVTDANPLIGNIVASAKGVMLAQQNKEPSPANTALLVHVASFQSSFYAMVAGLRGYVTTGRESFKYEYEANMTINEVNLASRLQAHADLGGILLAHETYALVKDDIETEELPR